MGAVHTRVLSGRPRPFSVVVAAVVLVASLWFGAEPAFASPAVAATSVDVGQGSTITVSGCSDSGEYRGAQFTITASTGAVVDNGPVTEWTFTWTTTLPDLYRVRVTCLGVDGVADASSEAAFAMWPTFIDISPDAWALGEPVTLQAVGFTSGEQVGLRLTNQSGATVSQWPSTAAVDDSSLWTFEVMLPDDLAPGVYTLTALGAGSDTTRVGGFEVAPGGATSPRPTTTTSPTTPNVPSTTASPTTPAVGGLPDTGSDA